MTLRELLAGAGLDRAAVTCRSGASLGHRRSPRSPASPTAATRRAGDAVLLRAGLSSPTATTSPPTRCSRGAAALVCERPLGSDVPEVVVPSVRAAMAPLAAAFYGDPRAQLRVVGRDRHERQDHDRLPGAAHPRGGRHPDRAARHGRVGRRRAGVEEVERTTPEAVDLQATFARMLDGGRPRLRDGGVLACARPAPRGRDRRSTAPCSRT